MEKESQDASRYVSSTLQSMMYALESAVSMHSEKLRLCDKQMVYMCAIQVETAKALAYLLEAASRASLDGKDVRAPEELFEMASSSLMEVSGLLERLAKIRMEP